MSAFITATGLTTAVGVGTAWACAAMRAGIDAFVELPYFDNEQDRIIGAPLAPLGWSSSAPMRVASLLTSAVEQIAEQLEPETRAKLAVIFVGCELDRPTIDDGRAHWLATVAARALGEGPSPRSILVVRGGAPASFQALALARDLLATGEVVAVLVCVVDSLLDGRSLLWLSQARPLRSTQRSRGTIPGEAAAALLIRATPGRDRAGALMIAGLGLADEPAARSPEVPLRADGLTRAIRTALAEAGLPMHEVGLRLASGAGGNLEFKEQILALTRTLRERIETLPLWLCAETLGDVGAAAGLVQIAWVHEAARRGYLPGSVALATAAARTGERAAAILRRVGGPPC